MSSNLSYNERVNEEIEHYNNIYLDDESRSTLTQRIPPSWRYLEIKAYELICGMNEGRSASDEVVDHIMKRGAGRILSIGSGPGGQEIEIARRLQAVRYEIVGLDLNPNLIAM
jgi:hypothetical protein